MKNSPNLRGIIAIATLAASAITSTPEIKAQGKKVNKGPSQEEYYSTSNQNISQEDRRKANELRNQTVNSIKTLLSQKHVKGSQRFELLLRLGELHSESHDYIRDEEMLAYEKAHQAWETSGKKGPAPKLSDRRSKAQLANAATSFRQLVKEFPKHPRTAAALYALGKVLSRMGDDGSVVYFEQLIANHKKSPLVADAHLALGEFYFEKHNISKAQDSYKKFLAFKDHPAYPYGVYKLGWAYYNATPRNDADAKANIDRAISSFKLAIRLSDQNTSPRQYRINLKDEAIKDLIMVWAETEDVNSAWAYFQSIGAKDSFYTLLEILGDTYSRQGKNSQAIIVYSRLVKESPTRANNHLTYAKLLELYDGLGQPQKVVSGLEDMDKNFVKSSTWTRSNAKDPSALAEARSTVEFNLHRYGTLYHNRGQKSKNKELLSAALKIYDLHLSSFPDSKNSYDIRYYFADLLFEFNRFENAADQYANVISMNPRGKHTKDAAMNAVVALNKLDQTTKYDKLPPAGQVPKPLEIPKVKQKLIESLDRYVSLFPREKNGYPMRFTAAQVYFDYGQYNEALARFEKISTELPNTTQGEASLKVILSYQMQNKNWENAVTAANKHLARKDLSKDMKAYITGVLRNALYNQAADLERAQKHEEAGRAFLAFQKAFSWDKTAGDKALLSAANNFYKASMLEDAQAANLMLIQQYPESNLAPNAYINIAQTYEALAQYARAAQFYEQFAVAHAAHAAAPKALFNAAALSNGLKQYDNAKRLYTRFVRFYPKNEMAHEARMEVARIEEQQGNNKAAIAAYRAIYDAPSSANIDETLFAGAKASILMLKNGEEREGNKLFAQVRGKLRGKNAPDAFEARRVIAESLFNNIESNVASFKQMHINNPRTIEADIKRKQARLEQLAKRFEDVISIENQEYTVASIFRLGELHENFSESLLAAAAPEGATPVQVSQFKSSIEKLAFPLRTEAYKFYETAYKRSQELETLTVWTRSTYEKMAELQPEKNPEVWEIATNPAYMASSLTIEPAVARLAH